MMSLRKLSLGKIIFGACFCLSPNVLADTGSEPPSCTLADVTSALAADPNCSLQNTVFYGSNVVDFVTSQCAPFIASGTTNSRLQKACSRCAKDAWAAYSAAAKAKLINGRAKKENLGRIKKICGTVDRDDGDNDSDSDALKMLYGQLKLCLPQEGQPMEPSQCNSCALTALNAALESMVINQGKFEVMKTAIQTACSAQGGDSRKTPTPVSTLNPEENSLRKYGQGLKACFDNFAQDSNRNIPQCLGCIAAVDATGLDPKSVNQYMSYATSYCNGNFASPTPVPSPSPTPVNSENSFAKLGQGINACFQQYLTDAHDTQGCLGCINSLNTSGLNQTYVNQYMTYATAQCNGTSIQA